MYYFLFKFRINLLDRATDKSSIKYHLFATEWIDDRLLAHTVSYRPTGCRQHMKTKLAGLGLALGFGVMVCVRVREGYS